MPKGSEELTSLRKEEIINACAALYETMSFKDITIRDIGEKTSFTRTSIYNYFQTKEEIFLALLQREHEAWCTDLEQILQTHEAMRPDEFADALAHTLESRGCMLKLMSMNLYDMEGSSRIENLVAFKIAYANVMHSIVRCLNKFFPGMTEQDKEEFLYAFSLSCSGFIPTPPPPASKKRLWNWPAYRIPTPRSMRSQNLLFISFCGRFRNQMLREFKEFL